MMPCASASHGDACVGLKRSHRRFRRNSLCPSRTVACERVRNLGRDDRTRRGKQVLFASHYDSTRRRAGAADEGRHRTAMLEIAHLPARQAHEPPAWTFLFSKARRWPARPRPSSNGIQLAARGPLINLEAQSRPRIMSSNRTNGAAIRALRAAGAARAPIRSRPPLPDPHRTIRGVRGAAMAILNFA